jgi:uncharacterized protein
VLRVALAWLCCAAVPVVAAQPASAPRCDAAWQRAVNARLEPGDGHGPDLGSAEWFGAVEHQLGLRGTPGLPPAGSRAWCARVQQALDAAARAPACRVRAAPGSIPHQVCRIAMLATLDLKLAAVYRAAQPVAANEHPRWLVPTQRGWMRSRDECWKAGPDPNQPADRAARAACVRERYRERILELQALYRLVPVSATARWRCDDGSEVQATRFDATDPPSQVAERGDQTALMTQQPAASGTLWQGRNESLHEKGPDALVVWGWQAPVLRCSRLP